jgi:hypothetical protein
MDQFESIPPDAYNPVTRAKHRRELFWQVTVPFVVLIVLILLMTGLAWGLSYSEASRWADISIIMMIIPMMLFTLISAVILVGSLYGLLQLIRVIPFYSFKGFNLLLILGLQMGTIEDKILRPFVEVRAFKASLQTFGRSVKRTNLRR